LKNETAEVAAEVPQRKQGKKKGKIAQVYKLHQKGLSAKEIASKLKINERLVRAYIWRMKNPEKYKALLNKYFARRRQKEENETIKTIVKNNHKTGTKEKKAEKA
jgi:predicted transcriptional regulator